MSESVRFDRAAEFYDETRGYDTELARATTELLTAELRAPNGIAFSPDERTLYVSNAERERALALDDLAAHLRADPVAPLFINFRPVRLK